MVEQSHTGEGHDHVLLVALGDDQVIPDGAAGLGDILDTGGECPLDHLCQLVKPAFDVHGIGGQTAGAAAEQNGALAIGAVQLGIQRLGTGADLFIEFGKILRLLALLLQIFLHDSAHGIHGLLGVDLAVDGNGECDAAGADAAQGIDGDIICLPIKTLLHFSLLSVSF